MRHFDLVGAKLRLLCVLAIMVCVSQTARGDVVTIIDPSYGRYDTRPSAFPVSIASAQAPFFPLAIGHTPNAVIEDLRAYLVFDIPSLPSPVTDAYLSLYLYDTIGSPGGIRVFDVSTPLGELEQTRLTADPVTSVIFDDLGSGAALGEQALDRGYIGMRFSIHLNDAALASLTAANGNRLAFGLSTTHYAGLEDDVFQLVGAAPGYRPWTSELILATDGSDLSDAIPHPEPRPVPLPSALDAGILLLICLMWQRLTKARRSAFRV